MTSTPDQLVLTREQEKLLEASALIRSERPERIDFLHSVQCQCGIPCRNPGEGVREWDRKQGGAVLRIEAGAAMKDQLGRLAASTIRMGIVEEGRAVQVNTQIVTAFDLWFPKQPDQRVLWSSTVRLSEEYYQSLGRHAVPLDHRAVAALSTSSMAPDTYVWLAQRLHRIPPGKPQSITWAAAHEQLGQAYARLRDFRRTFLQTLAHIKNAYPSARLSADEQGLTLEHSPPPVAPRYVGLLLGSKPGQGKFVAPPTGTPAADSHAPAAADAAPALEPTP
jgi:hypothetical protein